MKAFLGGVAAMLAVAFIAVFTLGNIDHSVAGRDAASGSLRLDN